MRDGGSQSLRRTRLKADELTLDDEVDAQDKFCADSHVSAVSRYKSTGELRSPMLYILITCIQTGKTDSCSLNYVHLPLGIILITTQPHITVQSLS